MSSEHTRVLIVGGSVVGASAALFLAARGMAPVLVEKHRDVSTRLRAKLFYPRTMEAFRAVGADEDVHAIQRDRPPADHAAVVASLAGPEVRRWRLPAAADFSAVSPSPSALVKQADLEEVVRTHARRAGADLRLGHRLTGLDPRDDGVVAHVVDADGRPCTVEAEYVLAADGNRSAVREGLGIGRSGPGSVADVLEIGFAADLRAVLAGRRLAFAFVDRPDRPFLSWNTGHDGGTITLVGGPGVDDRATAGELLGLPAERITPTYRRRWEMGGRVADSYRVGRVLLLGDAVHVMPPVGGFGANAGIQDAWNLAAKLVTVLRGHADPRLLDDYQRERRPVGRLTVDQALRRLDDRAPEHVPDVPLLSEAAVAIGYRYADGGAVAAEPDRWRGEPGTRLPHVRLASGASTLDLVRDGKHLLLTGPRSGWPAAAGGLDPAVLDVAVAPATRPFGIDDDGALLVRPDHVVAWRSRTGPATAAALREALDQATGRASSGRRV
jgi:putative polyketide hydroxylase